MGLNGDTRSFDPGCTVSRQEGERELAGSGSGPQAPSSEGLDSGVSVRGGTSSRSWREKSHRAENPHVFNTVYFSEVFTKSLAVLSIPTRTVCRKGSVCRGAWGRRARCVSFCRVEGRWGHGAPMRAAQESRGLSDPRVWGADEIRAAHVLNPASQDGGHCLHGEGLPPRGPGLALLLP